MKKKSFKNNHQIVFLQISRDLRYQLKSIITKLHLCEQSSTLDTKSDLLHQYSTLDSDFQTLSEIFDKSKEIINKVFTIPPTESNVNETIISKQEEQFMIETKSAITEKDISQGDLTFEAYTGPLSDSDDSDFGEEDTMKNMKMVSMQLAKIFMGKDNSDSELNDIPLSVSTKNQTRKRINFQDKKE